MSLGVVDAARARPLRAAERVALGAEIVRDYVRVRLLLRRRNLPDTLAQLRADPGAGNPPAGDLARTALRLGRAVRRVLALLPADSRCLMQSLVLTRMLARRGIHSELVLAAGTDHGFEAHAWLECSGRAVLPPAGPELGRLVEL